MTKRYLETDVDIKPEKEDCTNIFEKSKTNSISVRSNVRPRLTIDSMSAEEPGNMSMKEDGSSIVDLTTDETENVHVESNKITSINSDAKKNEFETTLAWPPASELTNIELEAIFFPKFENEASNDKRIRENMLQSIFESTGYLEFSLKHSGSLVLWSGNERFYSKNSVNNKFSLVGEILLREHFIRSWSNDYDERMCSQTDPATSCKFAQCSDEIKKLNLTCSFECVTSVLGDHGDIPNRDFMILTAIADKTNERFYSTSEVIEFAQKWRLPHNDVWIFRSPVAANSLFHLYDTTRETGLADTTISALNAAADYYAESMYPHTVFQGNILEGIVIRLIPIVSNVQNDGMFSTWKILSVQSRKILKEVPSEKPLLTRKLRNKIDGSSFSTLSELFKNYGHSDDEINERLLNIIKTMYGESRRNILPITGTNTNKTGKMIEMVNGIVKKMQSSNSSMATATHQTERIAELMQKLRDLDIPLVYKIYRESYSQETSDSSSKHESTQWLCILHILRDSAFTKYHQNMRPGQMMLFRGFVLRFKFGEMIEHEHGRVESVMEFDSSPRKTLMLKMKFLPYMVRTFGCRNGLGILSSDGHDAFEKYTLNLLRKWAVSFDAIDIWQPFFNAWGRYAYPKLLDTQNGTLQNNEPPLSASSYLYHLEQFSKRYYNGEFGEVKGMAKSSFRGLVVIVSLKKENIVEFGKQVAKGLGCKTSTSLKDINITTMVNAMRLNGGGLVCCCDINEKGGNSIRTLLKKYGDAIYVVLFCCSEKDIIDSLGGEGAVTSEVNRMKGKIKYWRSMRCKFVIDIGNEPEEIPSLTYKLCTESDKLPEPDNRPGLLVFFPGIPGSGKSSLCDSISVEDLGMVHVKGSSQEENINKERKLIVYTGDKLSPKIKYWPSVQVEKVELPSSIFIADKNAPPSIWKMVGKICTASQCIAIPVFPDSEALKTTIISNELIRESGSKGKNILTYPFSLHYLAICILRVLDRPAKTHEGNLDSSLPDTCMIVIKFFGFYEGYTSSELIQQFTNEMLKTGAQYSKNILRVPFFKQNEVPDIPDDLQQVLEDALRLRHDLDITERGKQSKEQKEHSKTMISSVEERIRKCITLHESFLRSLASDIKLSTQSFFQQLKEHIDSLDHTETKASKDEPVNEAPEKMLKIASIDVSKTEIDQILINTISNSPHVATYFKNIGGSNLSLRNEENSDGGEFIEETHLTMAHFSQSSQSDMISMFGPLEGMKVNLSVTGLLYSEKVAALSVLVPQHTSEQPRQVLPPCKNKFPHITIWCRHGISAKASNKLPKDVANGRAHEIVFDKPIFIDGIVKLWEQ